jgi:hypothetical protein
MARSFNFKKFDDYFREDCEKKLLNSEFYPKWMVNRQFPVRDTLGGETSYHVQHGGNILLVKESLIPGSTWGSADSNFEGYSAPIDLDYFQSRLDSRLQFFAHLDDHKLFRYDVNKFLNAAKGLQKSTTKGLLLLGPCKGGYKCYSNGIIGFLPRSQVGYVISSIIQNLKKRVNSGLSTTMLIHSMFKYSLCWLPVSNIRMVTSIRPNAHGPGKGEEGVQFNAIFMVSKPPETEPSDNFKVGSSRFDANDLSQPPSARNYFDINPKNPEIPKLRRSLPLPESRSNQLSSRSSGSSGNQGLGKFSWKRFITTTARCVK